MQTFKQFLISFLALFIYNQVNCQGSTSTTNNACNIARCITCDSNTQLCTQCEQNYSFNAEQLLCVSVGACPIGQYKLDPTGMCQDCHSTCKSCNNNGPGDCYDCIDGYTFIRDYFSSNYICVSCSIQNCQTCYDNEMCSVCADGYLLNKQTGKCEACKVDFCQECNSDSAKCDLCLSSYTLQTTSTSQKCLLKGSCPKGYYQDSQGSCTPKCDPACIHCYGPGNDKCYQCAAGYYLSGAKCFQCDSSCQTCVNDDTYCTSCTSASGLVLNGSKCKKECNNGEFNNNGFCQPCPLNCSVCLDQQTCTQCADPTQYTVSNGKCIGICNTGKYNRLSYQDLKLWRQYYFTSIISKLDCQNCSLSCKECTLGYDGSPICTSCYSGYILTSSNTCKPSCNQFEYFDYDPYTNMQRCMRCPFPCLTCKDRYSCDSCVSSDYQLQDGGKCTLLGYTLTSCAEGQIKFSELCLDKCPQGTVLQGDVCSCDYSCSQCLLNVSTMLTECILCNNIKYFSYQGQCQATCPSNFYQTMKTYSRINATYNYYGCVEKCPIGLLSQISKDSKQCVKTCAPGYTLYQNALCINLPCAVGTYFDSNAYNQVLNSGGNLQDQTQYCFNCDPSCALCDGKLNSNCVKCITNYVQQKKTTSTGSTTTVCQPNCDDGFIKTQWIQSDNTYVYTCTVCTQSCQTCKDGYYKIDTSLFDPLSNTNTGQTLYNCYSTCPSGTEPDNNNYNCNIKTSVNVSFDYTDSVDNLFSVQSNINVILTISTIINLNSNPTISCTLVELSLPLGMKNQGDGQFTKYYAVIPSNTLQENQTYSVQCSVTILNLAYKDTETFTTFKYHQGNFSSNINEGVSIQDSFTFNINNFYIEGLDPDSYILQYKVDVEMATVTTPFSNITIFQTDAFFYNQNPTLIQDFNYQLTYFFPQLKVKQDIKIYLTVYGVSTLNRVTSIQVTVTPQDANENLKTVTSTLSNILSMINSDQTSKLSLDQLKKFSSQLKGVDLVPYLDIGQKIAIAKQKMLSNRPYIENLISCKASDDCSGRGQCKMNITSYYNKCNCNDGYSGETCAWKTVDLQLVQKVYYNSLDMISQEMSNIDTLPGSPSITDKLSSIVDQLNIMASIRDIFSSDVTNKFLSIINQDILYSDQNTYTSANKLLSVNDYTLDILRKASSVTTAQIQNIKDNFEKSIFLLQSSLKSGQDMSFSLNNVNGQIKDLTYSNYGGNSQITMNGDASSFWSIEIPSSQLGYIASNLYSQSIVYPSDIEELVHDYKNTTFSLVASNIIDITIRQKDTMDEFKIKNSNEPIKITLKREITNSDLSNYKSNYTLNCTYQLTNGTWTSEGLKLIDNGNNLIQCQSNHLTNFALRIQSYDSALFVNPENDDQDTEGFKKEIFLVSNFIAIIGVSHIWGSIAARRQIKNRNAQRQPQNGLQLQQQMQQNQNQVVFGEARNQQVDSIFINAPSPLIPLERPTQYNQELKLEGVHVVAQQEQEPKMIAGLPIFPLEDEMKKVDKKKEMNQRGKKLQIDQIDINNANMIQQNPEKIDLIAQNLARRLKEQEIDICNSDDPKFDKNSAKHYKEKEVNFIPISTFYQPVNQISPQQTILNQEGQGQDNGNNPFTLDISPDLPQGVPVQENEEKKEDSLKEYAQKLDRNKQYVNQQLQQEQRQLIFYHPLYSFTRSLQVSTIPIRIFLFFQIFALYQQLTMAALLMNDSDLRSLSVGTIISIFFQVLLAKGLLQFIIPLFLQIVALFEKFCFTSIKFAVSPILKYFCLLTFSIYSLVMFTNNGENMITMSDFSKFIFMLFINVIGDYFMIDFIVIKMQQCCNSQFILRLIKNKNLDVKYD